MSRSKLFKVFAILVGAGCMFVAGGVFTLNFYSECLQKPFNLTQSEVKLIRFWGYAGFALSLPAGLLRLKVGTIILCTVGLVLSVAGYLLAWGAFLLEKSHQLDYRVLCLIYFLIGHGATYLYLVGLWANVRNFKKHRATVFGFFNGVFLSSAFILNLLHKLIFQTEWSKCLTLLHYSNPNDVEIELSDFFLFMAILSAIFGFSGILTLHEYRGPSDDQEAAMLDTVTLRNDDQTADFDDIGNFTAPAYEYGNESARSSLSEDGNLLPSVGFIPPLPITSSNQYLLQHRTSELSNASGFEQTFGVNLICKLPFHLLVWPFVFCSAFSYTVTLNFDKWAILYFNHSDSYNGTVLLISDFILDQHSLYTFFVQLICGALIGLLCDLLYSRGVPRCNFLLAVLLPCTVVTVMSSLIYNEYCLGMFTILSLIQTGTRACMWAVVPSILKDMFGSKYFAINYTCVLTMVCIVFLVVNFVYTKFILDVFCVLCLKYWLFAIGAGFFLSTILILIFSGRFSEQCTL